MKHIKIIVIAIATILTLVHCSKNNDPTPNSLPTDLFNTVWNDFDRNYPYFIHKKIDWDSVYQVYYPKVSAGMKSAELADVIGEMTLVLKDIHVNFNASYTHYQYRKRDLYPENPPTNVINYLSNISVNNSIAIYGDISNSKFSYLRLKTFNGSSGSYKQLASQLDSLINRDGLIIDIRDNGGGNELNGRTIAGKFVQKETLYKYVRIRDGEEWNDFSNWNSSYFPTNQPVSFNKEIILLTNRGVYSSAELFVLMMKTYPGLTLVGDTSGGASANPVEKKLNNGWTYRISTWQAAGLDYSLIEDNGIAPDHYVLMDNNSIDEGKDVILEKAIELLNLKKPSETKKANPGKDWLSVDNRLSSS